VIDISFRPPSEHEKAILAKLFECDFLGRNELLHQLAGAEVKTLDKNGSLEFRTTTEGDDSPITLGPAVEARYSEVEGGDLLGVCVNLSLFVNYGRLWSLDIYKDDSSPLLKPIDPEKFWLFTPRPVKTG
jgi:hypothetical protein